MATDSKKLIDIIKQADGAGSVRLITVNNNGEEVPTFVAENLYKLLRSAGWSDAIEAAAKRFEGKQPSDGNAVALILRSELKHTQQEPEELPPFSIATDDDVERVAKLAGWNNRHYMTPVDYSIWCDMMRKFVALSQPAAAPVQWDEAQRICDLPVVDEAIRNLLADQTGDNTTCMVRAILEATAPVSEQAVPEGWKLVRDAMHRLIERHKYDAGMFPQVADEHHEDIEVIRKVLSDIEFYESRIDLAAAPSNQSQGDKQ